MIAPTTTKLNNVWVIALSATALLALSTEGCRRRRKHEPDPSIRAEGRAQLNENPAGEVPVVDVPDWRTPGTLLRLRLQPTLRVHCGPATTDEGRTWGTDVYTDDSAVCVAALHSGLVTREAGGEVQIAFLAGAARYQGTIRNSITSGNFGTFGGSFSFIPGPRPGLVGVPVQEVGHEPGQADPWAKTAHEFRGQLEQVHTMQCPPGDTHHNVWGVDLYTDDSSICSAAVHAGRITFQGGTVEFFMGGPVPVFAGSVRNGVTSRSYAAFDGCFVFDRAVLDRIPRAPEGTTMYTWSANFVSHRELVERLVRVWCPPGGTASSVWGSGPYTDDSSVCTAAVHSGLISLSDGGQFTVVKGGPKEGFVPSVRHGITTSVYAAFPGSFTVRR